MLEIEELRAGYGKVRAVDGVSLNAAPQHVTLVLGANGAGKTTTLSSVAGLHRPDGGTVRLDGEDVTGQPAHRMVARGLSLVPEGRRVFGPLTVLENLHLGAHVRGGRRTAGDALAEVFELFPILSDRRSSAAGLLSGGEQQMLAFGRALMSRPRVILLDEPSMGLAPAIVDKVLASVRQIADSGIAVVMVEQNAEAALDVADTVVAMARGQVVHTGLASEARSNAGVLRAFLGEAALAD